jgi:predicted nucleotidyltransferase
MVRKNEHMFKKMNITPLRVAVLTWLARNPNKEFYVREVSKAVNGSLGGCHEALKSLYNARLLDRRKSGRNVYYSVNNRNSAVKYFKIFVNIHELYSLVQLLQDKSTKIVLFGSCALGEDTMESDIDILIITLEREEVRSILETISLSRDIAAIVLSPTDFMKAKEKDKAFYSEVTRGIMLWGDGHEGIR